MRRLFALLIAVLLVLPGVASAKPRKADGYDGPDAGRLVLSITQGDGAAGHSLALLIRKIDEAGAPDPGFRPVTVIMGTADHISGPRTESTSGTLTGFLSRRDMSSVIIKQLPPGAYEVFNFSVSMSNGFTSTTWRLPQDVSARFQLKPNSSIYIGEFEAVGMSGPNLIGIPVPAGARFVVNDESERDLEIALRKDPYIRPEISILDVSGVKSPYLVQGKKADLMPDVNR